MPLQINECKNCGKLPDFGYDDMGGGYADLILYCDCKMDSSKKFNPKNYNEGRAGNLVDAVQEWNGFNPLGQESYEHTVWIADDMAIGGVGEDSESRHQIL